MVALNRRATKARRKSGFFLERLDAEVPQLLLGGASGAIGHQVLSLLGLGKGNDVPDAFSPGENGNHAVQAEGDSPVRGGAVGKGFQHVAESAFNDLGGDLENFLEDFFLKIGLVDPDASSAQFDTVKNDVVVLSSDFLGFGLEKSCVLLHGCRKGVVGGHVAPFLLIVGHEGEVHDPEEFPVPGIPQNLTAFLEQGGGLEPSSPEYVAGALPWAGGKKDDIPILDREPVVALSVLLGGIGFFAPQIIPPIRRSMGYDTSQWDGRPGETPMTSKQVRKRVVRSG